MKFFLTGDCHRNFSRFKDFIIQHPVEQIGMIILGDAGININRETDDFYFKRALAKKYPNITFYLVRGNHEERPNNVTGMCAMYDQYVDGSVYLEPKFPHIKYFIDGGVYRINHLKTLVIGGAYSVDKFYRLERNLPWFASEQLTAEEQTYIAARTKQEKFDIVLTHTCPITWEPTDLFLPMINQQQVDKTMENFLQEIKENISWKYWFFGHYHEDRMERPYVRMFYRDIVSLDEAIGTWQEYDKTQDISPWYTKKSPHFYWD